MLLIRPSALGDVCRTAPVIARLRARFPCGRIDWLVQDGFVDAVSAHPGLDRVIPFPRRQFARRLLRGRPAEFLSWLERLRRDRYDLVIDAQGLFRSGFIGLWTRAGARVGPREARELAWLGYTRRVRTRHIPHTVDRMLSLVEPAASAVKPRHAHSGAEASGPATPDEMRLWTPPKARLEIDAGLPADSYAVLAPTSRWAGKRWPADRWVRLAEHLLNQDPGLRLIVVGGPTEGEQAAPLLELADREPRVTSRLGAGGIAGLLAMIERARLVVALDSAACHIAVGFARPLVALFGPTDPARVGPYRREADVLRRVGPDEPRISHKDARASELMARISVEEVASACADRLSRAWPVRSNAGHPD